MAASSNRSKRWRTWLIIRRLAIVGGFIALAIELRRPLFQQNFGTVDHGRVYRSSQPTGNRLAQLVRTYSVGSVLNLRGGIPSDGFYRDEVTVANQMGIEFFDLPLSAAERPSRRDLALILSIFDQCRYPLVIHCKWGADRTGLVSALYRLDKLGESPELAAREFTLAYGHVPLFGPQHLHEPLDEYAVWLRNTGMTHSSERFRDWLQNDYQAPDRLSHWPTVRQGPREIRPIATKPGHRR